MFSRLPSLLTLAVCIAIAPPPAGAEKLEPQSVPALLDALEALEAQIRNAGTQRNALALESFRAASASEKDALEFYLKCYKELYFTRDDAKEAEWRTWRERNEARLKDKGFALALKLQLQYLVLTLQFQDAKDIGSMVPAISKFIESISDSLEILEDNAKLLREPATGTVFAKVYLLDQTLKVDDWAQAPMDLPGIFGKTILPYLIENQPAQVATAWDSRIRFEQKLVEMDESPARELDFQNNTLPDLRWQKAQDMFAAGFEAEAVQGMITVIKAHSSHPSAPGWLQDLRSILEVAVYPNPGESTPAPPLAPGTPPAVAPTAPPAPQPR